MSTSYRGVNMYPCRLFGKSFSRLYNLKRHINEIPPTYSGVAPPPLSHGGVTPTPPQHDGVTYHHDGVTPHGGVTPPL